MSKPTIRTGVTSISTFSNCRRRWYYERYYSTDRVSGPMYTGSIVHSFLEGLYREYKNQLDNGNSLDHEEAYNSGLTAFSLAMSEKYLKEAKMLERHHDEQYVADLEHTALKMCFNYADQAKDYIIFFKEIIGVELPISYVDAESGVEVRGIVDLLVKMQNGEYVIVDHKTRSRNMVAIEDALTIDNQLNMYALIVEEQMGITVNQAVHNILYTRYPEVPTVLKSGAISKAKTTLDKTTYDLYLYTIHRNGLYETDYDEELRLLKERKEAGYSPYFDRVFVPVFKSVQHRLNKEVRAKFMDMRNIIDDPERYAYRSNNLYNCSYCPFLSVCNIELMGFDPTLILEEHFTAVENILDLDYEEDN